jgi:hypothetical protein
MGNTPNNNFPFPESTDLVKDGAQAIEDLADAIDTTLGVYSPATPMGVHLSTITFSGVASQSVNDVFSATYDNYRIFVSLTSCNQAAYLTLRLRVSGADDSTTQYRYGNTLLNTQSGQTVSVRAGNAEQGMSLVRTENSDNVYDASFDVGQPFASLFTTFKGVGTNTAISGNNYGETQYINGFFVASTSFTGFTLFGPTSMGGTVSVYGYNK